MPVLFWNTARNNPEAFGGMADGGWLSWNTTTMYNHVYIAYVFLPEFSKQSDLFTWATLFSRNYFSG